MSNDSRNHRIDYIELPAATVEQLVQAKAFYASAFGWEYKNWGPTYSDTQSSGVASGITTDTGDRQHRPLVVVYAKDLAASRTSVLAAGGTLTKDIFAFPGGRRFQFTDPAGNELAVWSDV